MKTRRLEPCPALGLIGKPPRKCQKPHLLPTRQHWDQCVIWLCKQFCVTSPVCHGCVPTYVRVSGRFCALGERISRKSCVSPLPDLDYGRVVQYRMPAFPFYPRDKGQVEIWLHTLLRPSSRDFCWHVMKDRQCSLMVGSSEWYLRLISPLSPWISAQRGYTKLL